MTSTVYYDPINGVLYGAPGGDGIPGGAGGGYSGNAEADVIPAESVSGFGQTFPGGNSFGRSHKAEDTGASSTYGGVVARAYGGYGGGAAYGAAGEDGSTNASASAASNGGWAIGAAGGKGATASPPPVPLTPGTGGYGGNGGGGAGACGYALMTNNYQTSPAPYFSVSGNTMTPGDGSDGGKGGDGVLLIYY